MGTLFLFLIMEETFQHFTVEYTVICGFVRYGLYDFEVYSFYTQFVEGFITKGSIFWLGCPPSTESLPSSGLGCRSWDSAAGEELPSYRWELRRGETGPFGCTCFGHVVQGENEKWRQLVLPRMKPQPQPGSWRRGSPCAQLNLPRMKPLQRRAWGTGGIGLVVAQMSLH